MPNSLLDQNAESIAKTQGDKEEDIVEIYQAPNKNEIRLIEVAEYIGTTEEVLNFSFDPKPEKGINFPISIAMVSTEEIQWIFEKKLKLPRGWGSPKELRLIYRRAE